MVRRNPKRKLGLDNSNVRLRLEKMNYGLVGKHSAVQVCRWTKSAIRGHSPCWKEKFYGISSAGCVQMTPSVLWCEHNCIHCWRPLEMYKGGDIKKDVGILDEPKEIINGIIEVRKKLLAGFKGRKNMDKKNFDEMVNPRLFTMSLSGEATLYSRLGEMFKEIRRRGAVSFLVTNGINPEAIREMARGGKNELPTQIVLSTNAPNEKLYKLWHRSRDKNAWKKFNETVDLMKELNGSVRRAIRLTLVRDNVGGGKFGKFNNMSKENVGEYARLIIRAEPDLIHIKGFKSVGYSRERLAYDKQPWFKDIIDYAKLIEEELGRLDKDKKFEYKIRAEDMRSCIVMLSRKNFELKIKKV